MIRKNERHSLALPCVAICIALVLGGCDRSGSSPDTQPPQPPPADQAPAVVDTPAAAPEPDALAAGPADLTELDEAARLAPTTESRLCMFEKLDGQAIPANTTLVVDDPSNLAVVGWVGNKDTMTRPPARLRIALVDGTRSWEVSAGPPKGRGDVAKHFGDEGMRDAGFDVSVDASALPPGEYRLSIVHEADGRTFACAKGPRIRIEG